MLVKTIFTQKQILLIFLTIVYTNSHSFENSEYIKDLNTENFTQITGLGGYILKNNLFIMFYADWCPHC